MKAFRLQAVLMAVLLTDAGVVYAEAQYRLGIMHALGRGVPRDYKAAESWFHKSADAGGGNAQLALGIMYEHGDGVSQDYRAALSWYLRAAEQGMPRRRTDLARCTAGDWVRRRISRQRYPGT
jgi:TPR repeat protein